MLGKLDFAAALKVSTMPGRAVPMVRAGLPAEAFETVRARLEIGADALAEIIGIAPRTLARRRQEGCFHKEESERLYRIGRLFEHAVEVFGGDVELTRHWFRSPQRAFGGSAPLAFADTEPGAREVENHLLRLEHGVFQ